MIEQTEALVSIDVNGGHGMFGQNTSQEKAVLDVNLAAGKQVCRYLCFKLFLSINRHAYIGIPASCIAQKANGCILAGGERFGFS